MSYVVRDSWRPHFPSTKRWRLPSLHHHIHTCCHCQESDVHDQDQLWKSGLETSWDKDSSLDREPQLWPGLSAIGVKINDLWWPWRVIVTKKHVHHDLTCLYFFTFNLLLGTDWLQRTLSPQVGAIMALTFGTWSNRKHGTDGRTDGRKGATLNRLRRPRDGGEQNKLTD